MFSICYNIQQVLTKNSNKAQQTENIRAQGQNMSNETEESGSSTSATDELLACLVILTEMEHRPFSADSLCAGLPLVDNRLTPELFIRAAKRAGITSQVTQRALGDIPVQVLPVVLLLNDNAACILTSIDKDTAQAEVIMPDDKQSRSIPLTELQERYTGYAIFAQREHSFDERTPEVINVRSRHWFWGAMADAWPIYRDVLLGSFLINLFALVSPLFVMNVYDRVVPNNAVETLWVLAIGVMIAMVFDFIIKSLRGYFIDLAGKKVDVTLSAQIYEKVMGLKMHVRPGSVGAFANNLRAFEGIRDFITSATISTLVDLPFVILFLIVIAWVGGPLVFVPIAGIPIVILYSFFIQNSLQQAVDHTFRGASQKNAMLIESLTAMETIKALGAEGVMQRKWESAVGYISTWGLRSRLLSSSSVNVATLVQQLSMVAIVVYGVYLIGDGELTTGGLIAAVMLTGRALAPTGQLANLASQYHQSKAGLHSLNDIMKLPVERPLDKNFIHRPAFEGSVALHDVNFTYPNCEEKSLVDVSFTIKKGEHVALIGRIGSGKTTIEKLLMGLYEPQEGAIRIDGIDTRQIDPVDLRRNIGYVPQDVTLFYGSVRENIVYARPNVPDEAVLRAAQIAGVTDFVNRHPMGFEMPVGERGEGLSGGQRQAIAIARALLLDPPILLMDEPSNSMDNSTEEQLKQRLQDVVKDKTLILVTHRASLLSFVNRLIVMDNGKLIADGPKDDVLAALKQGRLRPSRS